MDQTIWKYELEIVDEQILLMPLHSDILTVQFQGPSLCLWARVDPRRSLADRRILIVGTGNPMPLAGKHIGTVQAGRLVWHVFEG